MPENHQSESEPAAPQPAAEKLESQSPMLIALERKICATGTAWGLLKGAPTVVLAVWWLVRHASYFLLLSWLLTQHPESKSLRIAIGVFILAVHSYKMMRFAQQDDFNTNMKTAPVQAELCSSKGATAQAETPPLESPV